MKKYIYLYLHGFSSSPDSLKANHIKNFLNQYDINLIVPDLSGGNLSDLRLSRILSIIDHLKTENLKFRIIGSSLGALASSVYASIHPEVMDSLVLLAPAFDLKKHFTRILGEQNINRWKSSGKFFFQDYNGKLKPLDWDFMNDLDRYPSDPSFDCKAILIHGTKDSTVPFSSSYEYVLKHPQIEFVKTSDDHSLSSSYNLITNSIKNFWNLKL